MNRNHLEGREAPWPNDEVRERVQRFDSLSDGHLPDEDDPAWPSKSGQAD